MQAVCKSLLNSITIIVVNKIYCIVIKPSRQMKTFVLWVDRVNIEVNFLSLLLDKLMVSRENTKSKETLNNTWVYTNSAKDEYHIEGFFISWFGRHITVTYRSNSSTNVIKTCNVIIEPLRFIIVVMILLPSKRTKPSNKDPKATKKVYWH